MADSVAKVGRTEFKTFMEVAIDKWAAIVKANPIPAIP
jgi:hypothetical protein